MDITTNELKTMKVKQLRRLIRESVMEVLNETTYAGKGAIPKIKQDPKFNTLDANAKTNAVNDLNKGGDVELEEMARTAKGFRLADPNFDASQYANKRVSGTSLTDIINYFRENPGAEKTQLQAQFGFVRPQIANAVVNGLLDAGILVKLGAGGEAEATPEPGEETPTQATEPEDLFVGSTENPLAIYFDNEPNATGEEDFNTEEEPTTGELEPGEPTPTSGMSDADYEAFMKYDDLKNRLDATKSNLLKMKRRKGTIGDISDVPSSEEQRLRDLKKSLETRIDAIVKDSPYLQKRIGKMTGKVYEPVEVEPEEDTDAIDEAYNAEYELRKLQFYAGIIK